MRHLFLPDLTLSASAFFFSSLYPPSAAFFLTLKICWFIRVGGTSDMVAFLLLFSAVCPSLDRKMLSPNLGWKGGSKGEIGSLAVARALPSTSDFPADADATADFRYHSMQGHMLHNRGSR